MARRGSSRGVPGATVSSTVPAYVRKALTGTKVKK